MAERTGHGWGPVAAGVALLLGVVAIAFLPESVALAWHIRYGSRVTVGQYEVPVPLLWYGSFEDDQRSLSAMPVVGPFRRARMKEAQVGMVVYSVSPRLVADDRRALMRKLAGTESNLMIAGQPSTCFTTTSLDFVDITCLPPPGTEGLAADFMGDRAMVPQFYELLRQVRRKPGRP